MQGLATYATMGHATYGIAPLRAVWVCCITWLGLCLIRQGYAPYGSAMLHEISWDRLHTVSYMEAWLCYIGEAWTGYIS